MFLIGISLFIYLMYYKFFVGTTDPLVSFLAIIIFLSGLTLFSLGIISEYLVRLYNETRKLPLYIMKSSDYKKDEN